jgi:hypothetical protein
VALTSGCYVYRAGNFDGTTSLESQGLSTIVSNSGTYFNINRSTEPNVQSVIQDFSTITGAGGDASFEDYMQTAMDAVFTIGGSTPDVFYTDMATRRRFLKQLQKQRQYTVTGGAPVFAGGSAQNNKELRRGLEDGLTFNGVPFIASRRIDSATIYGLDTSTWEALEQSDVEWVENGDSVLHPLLGSAGRDAYRFSLYKDLQMFCNKPNSNLKCTNTL